VHIFRHLFVCFQTSVYTLGEFHKNRNNTYWHLPLHTSEGRGLRQLCHLVFSHSFYKLKKENKFIQR
jgi:hypothetical protein